MGEEGLLRSSGGREDEVDKSSVKDGYDERTYTKIRRVGMKS